MCVLKHLLERVRQCVIRSLPPPRKTSNRRLPPIAAGSKAGLKFIVARALTRSFTVIGLPASDFLIVFNSIILPNSTPLRDVTLHNLSDLEVKCNGAV